MNRQGLAWLGAALLSLALGGCQQTGTSSQSSGPETGQPAAAKAAVGAEVEAPDVFQLTAKGLWDGRPSLGGIWVAHADVTDPERVIIRNATNGKSVTGALFRRERDNPGPSVQVSSDAAEELGMLAGQPAELSIVALRRKEVELPPPPDAEQVDEPEAEAQAAAVEPAPETAPAAAPAAAAPAAEIAAETPVEPAAEAPAAEPAPKKKSGGLFGFLRKKPQADPALDAPVTGGITSGQIEQAPLDPIAGAAAAIDRAEAGEPLSATAPAATLKRSYIQIATFTAEANANKAAEKAKAAGLTATIIREQGNEKPYWRVLIGPAASVAERDALLARVKEAGFADAYPVTQ